MLKRLYILLSSGLLLLNASTAFSQKDTCRFILIDTASHSITANYYLASNINQWNPADSLFRFKKEANGIIALQCIFDKDTNLKFKITKGSWDKSECSKSGGDISNRQLRTDTAKSETFFVQNWKDNFPAKPKQHTASSNVHIIDTAFYMPQLNRTKRIWIYLPKGYATNGKHYPVMYMHDGQNLFDELTSGYGEWGIDECLDSLIKKGTPGCIIVGIDCGPKRMNEYNPYDTKRFGAGEGDLYVNFLVQTLKPYIDSHYRTLPKKKNTIIAGSSMGGLISYYAILKHPDVFGKAGIFSPSFWIAHPLKQLTDSLGNKLTNHSKLYFYVGGQEDNADRDMLDMIDELHKKSRVRYIYDIDPNGKHNERAWRKYFPMFYKWIMK